jgi:exosortase
VRPAGKIFPLLAATAGWLLFAFGEMLRLHDPLWRMTGGMLVAGATLLSVAWLAHRGGAALLRREAFALAFAWLALPWPMPLEKAATSGLLGVLTSAVVALLNFAGLAALQHGNIIEVSSGLIGMEDACSGVHSLQAGLMASVFLGEYFRATVPARAGLVAAGGLIMTLMNFLRVLVLAVVAARPGADAASWHDWAGGTATVLAFGALALLASRLRGSRTGEAVITDVKQYEPSSLRAGGLAVAAAFLLAPFVVASVFSPAPGAAPLASPSLRIRATPPPDGWKISTGLTTNRQQALLQFSEARLASVRTPDGIEAHVLRLFWKPGATMPLFAYLHTPALTLTVHGRHIVCTAYRFVQENETLTAVQALFCNGEARLATGGTPDAGRVRRVMDLWEGMSRPGMNEELLLYMPATSNTARQQQTATEILETVFEP